MYITALQPVVEFKSYKRFLHLTPGITRCGMNYIRRGNICKQKTPRSGRFVLRTLGQLVQYILYVVVDRYGYLALQAVYICIIKLRFGKFRCRRVCITERGQHGRKPLPPAAQASVANVGRDRRCCGIGIFCVKFCVRHHQTTPPQTVKVRIIGQELVNQAIGCPGLFQRISHSVGTACLGAAH